MKTHWIVFYLPLVVIANNFDYQLNKLKNIPLCINTVNLVDKEHFDEEQIGVKEPFPVTNCQFTS